MERICAQHLFCTFEAYPLELQPQASHVLNNPARISNCKLVNIERNDFNDMMGPLWDAEAEREPAFELWYRRQSSLVNNAPAITLSRHRLEVQHPFQAEEPVLSYCRYRQAIAYVSC
jgi:hypothetical protein